MDVRGSDGIVYAEPIGGSHHVPRSYPAGRICEAKGCHVILSVYNRADRCALHDVMSGEAERHRVHRVRRTLGPRAGAAA